MATHYLKTLTKYFEETLSGAKTAEVRLNDRNYQRGDTLVLQDFDPSTGYSGREITVDATHILYGPQFGIATDYCMISFRFVRAAIPNRYDAQTYYVKHPDTKWWGYFTVNERLGLLQVDCDFGNVQIKPESVTVSHRWESPGPDFKDFLLTASPGYVRQKFETWARFCWKVDSQKTEKDLARRLDAIMNNLWPLFLDQLRAERDQAGQRVGA